MSIWIRRLAYAWIIIVGALIITPDGIECIKCGPLLEKILAVISIVLGAAGFVLDARAEMAQR